MKPFTALILGTIGIMDCMKPSHENFKTVVGNLQTKMLNTAMKEADDGSLTFILFGGLAKEFVTSKMDMRVTTYDYVVCKIGIISFNIQNKDNKDKVDRKNLYALGVFNKWIDTNQIILKRIVDLNDQLFKNSLDKINF